MGYSPKKQSVSERGAKSGSGRRQAAVPDRSAGRVGMRQPHGHSSGRAGSALSPADEARAQKARRSPSSNASLWVMAGAGVLVLALGGWLLNRPKAAPVPARTTVATVQSPSTAGEFARRAKAKFANGDKQGAMADFATAVDLAQQAGDEPAAQQYSASRYHIQKFTTLNEVGR